MAVVKGSVLGYLTGQLGTLTLRMRYQKIVAYSKPITERKIKSVPLKNEQKKFGINSRFATFVNKIADLKKVWISADIEGKNSYTRLMKHNSHKNTPDMLSNKNIITPPGTDLFINEACISENGINVVLEIIDENKVFVSPLLKAIAVIYFYEPIIEHDNKCRFASVLREIDQSAGGNIFNILLPADSIFLDGFKNYKNAIIFLAIVKEIREKKKMIWTSTAYMEFSIDDKSESENSILVE